MRNIFELAVDAVGKDPFVSKFFLEKILKLSLGHWVFNFEAMFILVLLLNYYTIEKWSNKKDLVRLINSSCFKIVFILLAKVVVI